MVATTHVPASGSEVEGKTVASKPCWVLDNGDLTDELNKNQIQSLKGGKCFDPEEMKVEGTEIEGVTIFAKLEFETCFDNAKRLGKSNKQCLDVESAL